MSQFGPGLQAVLTDVRLLFIEDPDVVEGLGAEPGLGAFGINEVGPGMAPALGMHEAIDPPGKAFIDEVPIGE